MIKTTLKGCVYDPDPNGNERYYVRKTGHKKIRIRETFKDSRGQITQEFMNAYFEALEVLSGKRTAGENPAREDILLAGGPVLSITKVQRLRSTHPS